MLRQIGSNSAIALRFYGKTEAQSRFGRDYMQGLIQVITARCPASIERMPNFLTLVARELMPVLGPLGFDVVDSEKSASFDNALVVVASPRFD